MNFFPPQVQTLTPHQLTILMWYGEGKTSAEIAIILGKNIRTIADHRIRMYEKLDVENVNQLVLYAAKNNISVHGDL